MSQQHPGSEDEQEPAPRRSDLREQRRKEHRHPWLRRGVLLVSALVVVVLVLTVGIYLKLTGNIDKIDISGLGWRPDREASKDSDTDLGPLNILVMGSDSRAGEGNKEYGQDITEYGVAGARSDTTMLVHLAADRKSAVVISIPRDSMTKAPKDCKDPASTVQDGVIRQWNQNFTLGGPACTIKTFEGLTDIYVDHFVEVDFNGFQDMVDALGGVEVCTPVAIHDKNAHLDIPAGRQRLNGKQALGYVRTRKSLGDGSDIERIDRQQTFVASVIQEVTKSSLLLRPDKLYRFLVAATEATTTDSAFDVGAMRDVAGSVRSIGLDQIRFVKVPTQQYAPDHNRVEWTPAAEPIWKAIRTDGPLPGTKPASTPTTTPTTTSPLTLSPDQVTVRVVNDSGVGGVARQAAAALTVQGFEATYADGEGQTTSGVIVRHGPGREAAAKTVAAAFPGAEVQLKDDLTDVVEVSLGLDSPQVVEVPNRTGTQPLPTPSVTATSDPSANPAAKARTADQDICG